jgi:polyhydroxyalkanoate synthase subunit PhaC
MNGSRQQSDASTPGRGNRSMQAPRPLPAFLAMVQNVAVTKPDVARDALVGMRRYADVAPLVPSALPTAGQQGRVRLLGGHGVGPPVILVPSLINPASILHLDDERSLVIFLRNCGFNPFLVDWGIPTAEDREQDLLRHVDNLLMPLLRRLTAQVGPAHLIGYCLGGTLAIAAANRARADDLPLRSLTLLATPWDFSGYGDEARRTLMSLWLANRDTVAKEGMLPIEVLQLAFWGLDPERTVTKYAALAHRSPGDDYARRFATLENWANAGAPLTAAAALDLFDKLIGKNSTVDGHWSGAAGQAISVDDMPCRARHFTAADDRIAPAASAPKGITQSHCPSGHVGMIIGSNREAGCWIPLRDWLKSP